MSTSGATSNATVLGNVARVHQAIQNLNTKYSDRSMVIVTVATIALIFFKSPRLSSCGVLFLGYKAHQNHDIALQYIETAKTQLKASQEVVKIAQKLGIDSKTFEEHTEKMAKAIERQEKANEVQEEQNGRHEALLDDQAGFQAFVSLTDELGLKRKSIPQLTKKILRGNVQISFQQHVQAIKDTQISVTEVKEEV